MKANETKVEEFLSSTRTQYCGQYRVQINPKNDKHKRTLAPAEGRGCGSVVSASVRLCFSNENSFDCRKKAILHENRKWR
jgi:hypothetical protein